MMLVGLSGPLRGSERRRWELESAKIPHIILHENYSQLGVVRVAHKTLFEIYEGTEAELWFICDRLITKNAAVNDRVIEVGLAESLAFASARPEWSPQRVGASRPILSSSYIRPPRPRRRALYPPIYIPPLSHTDHVGLGCVLLRLTRAPRTWPFTTARPSPHASPSSLPCGRRPLCCARGCS